MKPKPILSVLACLFILSACHKNKDANSTPQLSISRNNVLIDSAVGSTDTFTVNANVPWTLTVSPASASSWLQVSPVNGESTTIIHLSVTGRNTNTVQPVTISIQAAGNSSLPVSTLTVSQQGTLKADSSSVTLKNTSGSDTVHLTTNLAWKATVSDAWIHLDTTQGAGSGRLRISADTNRAGFDHTGTVTITAVNNPGVAPLTVQVKQTAFYIIYGFSPASGPVGTAVTLTGIFPATYPYVNIDGVATASVTSFSPTQMVITIPQGAVGGPIAVTNTFGGSNVARSATSFILKGGWNFRSDSTAGLPNFGQSAIIYNYNGTLYTGFGGGYNASSIYRFDTVTYHWTADITVPGNVPVLLYPYSYVLNNKLYVGGQMGGTSNQYAFWEYDLTRGNSPTAWRQLTTPPAAFEYAFTQGGNGYLQTGQNTNPLYQFSLSSASDPGTWTQLTSLNVTNTYTSGFTIGNTTYFGGGGIYDHSQVRAFNSLTLPSTTMTSIAAFPEDLNSYGFGAYPAFTIDGLGYVYNPKTSNIYSYDPVANAWTLFSKVPYTTTLSYFSGAIGGRIFAWDTKGSTYEYIP